MRSTLSSVLLGRAGASDGCGIEGDFARPAAWPGCKWREADQMPGHVHSFLPALPAASAAVTSRALREPGPGACGVPSGCAPVVGQAAGEPVLLGRNHRRGERRRTPTRVLRSKRPLACRHAGTPRDVTRIRRRRVPLPTVNRSSRPARCAQHRRAQFAGIASRRGQWPPDVAGLGIISGGMAYRPSPGALGPGCVSTRMSPSALGERGLAKPGWGNGM